MANSDQKWSFTGAWRNVCLCIRKRPFKPIVAAHNDLDDGYAGFLIPKRNKLARSD